MGLRHSVGSRAPELIVVMHRTATSQSSLLVEAPEGQPSVAALVVSFGGSLRQILPNLTAMPSTAAIDESHAELSRYRQVLAPTEKLDLIRDALLAHPDVEGAYIKPPASPANINKGRTEPQTTAANTADPVTPDFTTRQGYLQPSPEGVDALYAWTLPGGQGDGVQIIDCEWAWDFQHEDLAGATGGCQVGNPSGTNEHGTAVIGCIVAKANSIGVTGIAPNAKLATAAFSEDFGDNATSTVIRQAADRLSSGDILLLEIHRPGPNSPQQHDSGQQGYIAIEWWPDDFLAIRYAVSKGIIVVEAAGNGWENLDSSAYDTPAAGFPSSWTNPFHLQAADSGAIIVGAGCPPGGTHGRNQDTLGWNDPYVDRARCAFSNWGSRVDCQGWGWEVTTTGGDGELSPRGTSPERVYTDTFAGTSSASPIVTGTLACLQGILKAGGQGRLTPNHARALLRTTGAPQQAAEGKPTTQHIGNRPDLRTLVRAVLPINVAADASALAG